MTSLSIPSGKESEDLEKGVADLFKKVNPSKASGPDNIPNRFLKECAEELAPIFTTMCQHSIDTGELPQDWLNANTSCIYKKGDKHAAENYRPVSLTSVPCKLLEHIIVSVGVEFLTCFVGVLAY
jgi:hypothetical protein